MDTKIGTRHFGAHTYIMGILNVTPDSFSDGGHYNALDAALFRAEQMLTDGAAILDIGGESTRPGYTQISEEEELSRLLPVLRAIKARFDVPVSIDTYKASVAEAALCCGADMINDIWGLQYDGTMAEVVARYHAACCIMHNAKSDCYTHFWEELCATLRHGISLAKQAGIPDEKIILDGGVGFAKSLSQNLETIRRSGELQTLGYPVLLGTSRKSVIGLTLSLPVAERLEGTLATTACAVMQGCRFVRVHDCKENQRVIQMTEAILGKGVTYG